MYDLQKALDTVSHFEAELNGKTWRLVRTWYEGIYPKLLVYCRSRDHIAVIQWKQGC